MEEKLISVIIPTYNAEKTIERAICSVEDPAVEIVVVLDGEQPETERICRGLAQNDARIQILTQENQGCFVARRNGMLAAKGKYIMNLDSDDAYMPHTIEHVKALIAKYDEPDLIRFRYQKEPEGYDQYHYFADGALSNQSRFPHTNLSDGIKWIPIKCNVDELYQKGIFRKD